MGLVKFWDLDVSSEVPHVERVVIFNLIHSQTPERTSSLPRGMSLTLRRRRPSVSRHYLAVVVKSKDHVSRQETTRQRGDGEVDSAPVRGSTSSHRLLSVRSSLLWLLRYN